MAKETGSGRNTQGRGSEEGTYFTAGQRALIKVSGLAAGFTTYHFTKDVVASFGIGAAAMVAVTAEMMLRRTKKNDLCLLLQNCLLM